MLMPKRVKYRRVQRGRMKGKATRGNVVSYGEFGLAAQESSVFLSYFPSTITGLLRLIKGFTR